MKLYILLASALLLSCSDSIDRNNESKCIKLKQTIYPQEELAVLPSEQNCYSHNYLIQIDPKFSCQEPELIINAWLTWHLLLNNSIEYTISFPKQINNYFEFCTIKIIKHDPGYPYSGYAFSWNHNRKADSARIWIKENASDEELYSIALHEFGHVLGLSHSTDPKSIMFPQSPIPATMTEEDKKNVCLVWGC